jgi:pimeloyl-ACP methyl ester carboxylesterase
LSKKNLYLMVVMVLLGASGFVPVDEIPGPTLNVIDRHNQTTHQITDGDTIQLQAVYPQPVTEQEVINFFLDELSLPVGSCVVPLGQTSCNTQPFQALGWHWAIKGNPDSRHTLLANDISGKQVAQSDGIEVAARPVVLVHGFISNWETWQSYLGPTGFLGALGIQGFAVGDGQVPGKLNTGNLLNPVGQTNTIGQNAEILGQYIANVKQRTGAEMVDLVVHSMGGMISRYYIDRVMQERDVAQLIMLGSPMGGSDCSVLPAALGFYLPASIEIRQSYMSGVFNQQITHRHGIEFYDLGGTAIIEAFKSPCTDIPNDTVVSFGSINAIPLQSDRFDVIHSNLTLSQPVFDSFVRPLLQKTVNTFIFSEDPVLNQTTESALQFTRVYTGHVNVNGSTELTINIDPDVNVASFALYDNSRSVTTVVHGASGKVIELSLEKNGFIKVDDPASLFYLGYGFQNPKPGPWKVTVMATDATPPEGTDFAISVYFTGGARLETHSSTLIPKVGQQVDLGASLILNGEQLEITTGQAVIRGQDGKIEILEFQPGRNVTTSWTSSSAGLFAVDILVTGLAPDGSLIERTNFLTLQVQPEISSQRITINLAAILAAVLILLFLVFSMIFWIFRRMVRQRKSS